MSSGVELEEYQRQDDLGIWAIRVTSVGISKEGEISEVYSQGGSGGKVRGKTKPVALLQND